MKKIISLLLVLTMLLCVLPAASAEGTDPKITTYYLTLNKSIAINFVASGITDENAYVVLTDGENSVTTYAKNAKKAGENYVFTYSNVTPKTLDKDITATLYDAAGRQIGDPVVKSVKDYCLSVLNNTAASGNLKTLVVDLLYYGAAAQTYFGDTALVTDGVDQSYLDLHTQTEPTLEKESKAVTADPTADDGVDLSGTGLTPEDSVAIYFDISAASTEGLTLLVTMDGVPYKINTFNKVTEGGKEYFRAYFNKLDPRQMRKAVSAVVIDAEGNAVSRTFECSIESYANWAVNESGKENLQALAIAMMQYGDSTVTWDADRDGGVVEEEPEEIILLEDDFQDGNLDGWTPNHTAPGTASVIDGVCVLNSGGGDGSTTAGKAEIARSFEACGKVKFTLDYKIIRAANQYRTRIIIKDATGVVLQIMITDTNITVIDGGNDPAAISTTAVTYGTGLAFTDNTMYGIELLIDAETDTYTLKFGDNVVSGRRLTRNVSDVNSITFESTDSNKWAITRVYIDNLKVTQVTE